METSVRPQDYAKGLGPRSSDSALTLRMVGAVQDVTELVEAQRTTAESLSRDGAL
jgi:hypothetical protein